MSVGIKSRVENSVGCLSEKRLFIKRGKRVGVEVDSFWRPDWDKNCLSGSYVCC